MAASALVSTHASLPGRHRPSRRLGWLGPVSGDASAVPAKEGVGCDEPSVTAWPGECLGDGAEQRPVLIGERGPPVLAAEHGELVTQDDDLDVFGAPGPHGEAGQRREEAVQDAIHALQDRRYLPWSTPTSEFRAPTGLVSTHARVSEPHRARCSTAVLLVAIAVCQLLPNSAARGPSRRESAETTIVPATLSCQVWRSRSQSIHRNPR